MGNIKMRAWKYLRTRGYARGPRHGGQKTVDKEVVGDDQPVQT